MSELDKKYYTPSIEEFHVGFEFEFLEKGEYVKDTYMCNSKLGVTFDDMPELAKLCRVKYLDKDDIESLGWEVANIQETGFIGEYYIKKGVTLKKSNRGVQVDLHLVYQPISKWVLIWQPQKYIVNGGEVEQDNTRFSGTIKNKSELVTLLKQLGI